MKPSQFTVDLLAWYAQHARVLPWRGDRNPYAVWVSEVMLQQTRVETVIPYFERWMSRFPDLASLACASQQEVLSAWEGLGYYSRARNLHQAAQIVFTEMGGEIPRDPEALAGLPGIGRYTAGAIASLAFGVDAPALDGNIRRVLARVFDVTEPSRSPKGEHRLWELAAGHLPPGQAGDYNQALMDLGATLCTPRLPNCPACPISRVCQSFALGIQDQRPVVIKKPATPHYVVTAAVICRKDQFLITQRPLDGLLGGLWEFPGGKLQPGENLEDCLQREIREELGVNVSVRDRIGVYRHAYTHFKITLHAFRCMLPNRSTPSPIEVNDLRWVAPAELPGFPMGKIDRQIARQLLAQEMPC